MHRWFLGGKTQWIAAVVMALLLPTLALAEDEEPPPDEAPREERATPAKKDYKKQKRYYVATDPNEKRVDAGIFHVGFAVGGNFYIEPKVDPTTKAPLGEYFKDFGFQAGLYFDYDYSALEENIPLGLRGMFGYKYALSSVHIFAFDGVVRRMFRFSEHASFGVGAGASAAVWYRAITSTSPTEEILFLPSFVLTGGFEFDPLMVDFKWLINRFGEDSTILGFELYVGFRL